MIKEDEKGNEWWIGNKIHVEGGSVELAEFLNSMVMIRSFRYVGSTAFMDWARANPGRPVWENPFDVERHEHVMTCFGGSLDELAELDPYQDGHFDGEHIWVAGLGYRVVREDQFLGPSARTIRATQERAAMGLGWTGAELYGRKRA